MNLLDKNAETTFSVLQFDYDGKTVIATINTKYKNYGEKKTYPWFLSLSIKLNNPTPEGLTYKEEADQLNKFEEVIEEKIKQVAKFHYLGRATWNGFREIIYYVDNPEQIAVLLQDITDKGMLRKFAFRCERDDNWDKVNIYYSRV